jgi:hypothetical protein
MHNDPLPKKIILSGNLQGFFFEGLSELNKKSRCPVPESIIYYSSDVLDKFALSEDFFETSDGKVREKILGMKLLEASSLSSQEQKKIYKEIGDTSLMICGYFSESISKKIVDIQYYSKIGRMAYSHLNNVTPRFLDIPHFYGMVATCFGSLTTLMTILASRGKNSEENLLFQRVLKDDTLSDNEMISMGVTPTQSKKVS